MIVPTILYFKGSKKKVPFAAPNFQLILFGSKDATPPPEPVSKILSQFQEIILNLHLCVGIMESFRESSRDSSDLLETGLSSTVNSAITPGSFQMEISLKFQLISLALTFQIKLHYSKTKYVCGWV